MSEKQKSGGVVSSLLWVAGGALGAWAFNKMRREKPAVPTRLGELTPQERADFARRNASTDRALEVMEDYGVDPDISFDRFADAVRRVEQDALDDYRHLQQVARRDKKQ